MQDKRAGNPEWKKGVSGNPNGRPVGSKNKATTQIREAYQRLTEDNLENMSLWLADIAADNPKEAMEMMIKLSEYVIPKMARTEVTGLDGEDLFKNISFDFGPSINDDKQRDIED
tara:strand:+ start:239 stop:583 length:345 start_codon:yes stop_codon:yes gene_type:complete